MILFAPTRCVQNCEGGAVSTSTAMVLQARCTSCPNDYTKNTCQWSLYTVDGDVLSEVQELQSILATGMSSVQ